MVEIWSARKYIVTLERPIFCPKKVLTEQIFKPVFSEKFGK